MKLLLFGQETERLLFRKVEPADFETWINMFDRPENALYLGLDPSKSAKELCTQFFEKVNYRYENKLGGMNALIHKSTGNLVGQCGLLIQEWNNVQFLEVGYAILPLHWNNGFALEASKRCIQFAKEQKFANRIHSIINVGNIGSEKVAQKNGMCILEHIADYKGSEVNLWAVDLV